MKKQVVNALNKLLADMHIINVKMHNYHWNVSGMQFHAIHEVTEAYYNFFFAKFDDVAERILQLEEKPVSTTKGYIELSTINEDEGNSFDAAYVFGNVIADFSSILHQTKDINTLAENDNDVGTQDLLSGIISWLEKEIWLLKSALEK